MQKVKISTPVSSQRKKRATAALEKGIKTAVSSQRKKRAAEKRIRMRKSSLKTGVEPIKAVTVKVVPVNRRNIANGLIASMDLDEMLEASKIVNMGLRGDKIPAVKSPKVQKYVEVVLQLNKSASTKLVAKKMQQELAVQIVERNKKTTDAAEAERLYYAFMEEE